jgi:hypothetical protein
MDWVFWMLHGISALQKCHVSNRALGGDVMNEIGVIDILDPVTDEVVTHCFGPTAEGKCPLASPDGIVLCHGCRIEARNLGPEYWNLWVPPTSTVCPSAWHLDEVGY